MLIRLPTEVLLRVLGHCDPDEIACNVACACRQLRAVCGDKVLWRDVLGLKFFHDLGLGRSEIEQVADLRAWYVEYRAQQRRTRSDLEKFIATGDPSDALAVTRDMPLSIGLKPKTLKHIFWGHWFSNVLIKLHGLRALKLTTGGPISEDPLDACIAASMAAGYQRLRSACLEIVDDLVWSTDAFFMTPLERIDLMISKVDTAVYSGSATIKSAIFVHLAARYNLVSATLVSFDPPAVSSGSAFVCVFLGNEQQCFIDFTRQHGIVRSTEEVRGRIAFLGASNNVRAGLVFEDILKTEPKVFNPYAPRHRDPREPSLSPDSLRSSYLLEDGARRYTNLFASLCMQALGVRASSYTACKGPFPGGNYQDLQGRLCTVYRATCVILEAHEHVCLVLDRYHLMRVPPPLIEPVRPVRVTAHPIFGIAVPQIEQLDLMVLGQYFERWDGERFV